MSIRNAGEIIKEARLNAGMSQEKLSEGICSLVALSNIEKGVFGVSPFTFQLLMQKTGHACEIYPIFENRNDFDCFLHLNHAKIAINSFHLEEAYQELSYVSSIDYNQNLLYYQEWIYYYSILQYYSGTCDHEYLFHYLSQYMKAYHPEFLTTDIKRCFLSAVSIDTLILYASELLIHSDYGKCYVLYSQLKTYIEHSTFKSKTFRPLSIKLDILYVKYLLSTKDYQKANEVCEKMINSPSFFSNRYLSFEFMLLQAISYYFLGKKDDANIILSNLFLASHAVGNYFYPYFKSVLSFNHISFSVQEALCESIQIDPSIGSALEFPKQDFVFRSDLTNGVFHLYGPDVLSIGKLIKTLRTEQKLSQVTLCDGLCSKSMLSKIENEQLNPGIILTTLLLYRLGLNATSFSFFGSQDETEYFNLMSFFQTSTPGDDFDSHFLQFEQLKNRLKLPYVEQAYELIRLKFAQNSAETFQAAFKALALTHKDFNLNQISSYRFTDSEFRLLTIMLRSIHETEYAPLLISIMQQLLRYKETNIFYNDLEKNYFPSFLYFQHIFLYRNNLFSNMEYFFHSIDYSVCEYTPRVWGMILFYHCQALGELNRKEESKKYGEYTYAILKTFHVIDEAQKIKDALMEDFQIKIGEDLYIKIEK